jgi:O-antigen/teichoic acid export membrane protein
MPTLPEDTSLQELEHPRQQIGFAARSQALLALFSGGGAREGYLAASDQAIISLSNFLATIILARNVSPTELGVYGVGFILLSLGRALQEGIVVQPLNVFGAALDIATFKRYASSSAVLQLVLAGSLSAAAAIGGWLLTVTGNDTAGPALFALWSACLTWQLQEFCRRLLYTRRHIPLAVLISALSNTVRLAIMIWWASQGILSGTAGITAIAWGALIALLPGVWFSRKYWTQEIYSLPYIWKNNWSFGRWVTGGALAGWISVEFYPVLTAGMVSFAAAGAYRAIQNLVAPIHMLLRAIDTFLTPRAARIYGQGGRGAITRELRLIYLAVGIPTFGVLAVAVAFRDQLLYLLYGDTYLPYSQGVIWMALFYALLFASGPLQSVFKAMRQSRPIFIANLAAMVAMITVGILAIGLWGVYGTIAGQVLNALLVNSILWGNWIVGERKDRRPVEAGSP